MRNLIRIFSDKAFTIISGMSIVFLGLILVTVLGPMLARGSSAVFFSGTVEFRKMQKALFDRGDIDKLNAEIEQTDQFRTRAYELIDSFKQGLDIDALSSKTKQIYREFGNELKIRNLPSDEFNSLRTNSRVIRDLLLEAFTCNDEEIINKNLNLVSKYESTGDFTDTAASDFFALARSFGEIAEEIDFKKITDYTYQLEQVEKALTKLLGPRPRTSTPVLIMDRFGATRWDMAKNAADELFWYTSWAEVTPGQPLEKIRTQRKELFACTDMADFFDYCEHNIANMLHPKPTVYWQYFIDDSTDGYYFGGVGPEILGTLLLTVLSMFFVVPLGVISAAYLIECAPDNFLSRMLRMFINTLAGVPSILFGLFGLAFFVLYFLPALGAPSKPSILAASMTLALLTLPVMIRASEEAIRSVPRTYKEASLGLGASRLRTFVCVTLPAALPGILTGVILSLSRVAGETAPILFTGAIALGSVPKSVFHPTKTLASGSYYIAVTDRIAMMVPHNQYGMVITLVLLILCLNAIAIFLRIKVSRKLAGH